jgi:hypothetical protein
MEADEHGMQREHTLWGSAVLSGSNRCAVRIGSLDEALWISTVSATPAVEQLDPGLCAYQRRGVYFRGLGDFTPLAGWELREGESGQELEFKFECLAKIRLQPCLDNLSLSFESADAPRHTTSAV